MSLFLTLVWLGGVWGADDAKWPFWPAMFWPFVVARGVVRRFPRKEGER